MRRAAARLLARRGLPSASRLEELALVLGAVAATAYSEWAIISNADVYETDARLHTYWMRRFQDSDLFHDPLTEALLRTGYVPAGIRGLYWLAARGIDPVRFGELLPLVLAPLSAWLVFRIVRAHTDWRPAAWLAAALFLFPWDILRFSGGHARAFAQPVALLAVYLLLRRRDVAAALVPPLGVLLYPPTGLTALGMLALGALGWRGRRPVVDRRRLALTAASLVAVVAALFLPGLIGEGGPGHIITREEARAYPDFGPDGKFPFFVGSREKLLTRNVGGFNLHDSGGILALAALGLLLLRPRNALLVRKPVWSMAVVSLALFVLAHALAFRLYLPTRYTYPLIPFFAIVVGIAWQPTWKALVGRLPRTLWPLLVVLLPAAIAFLAVTVSPLGSELRPESAWRLLAAHRIPVLVAAAAGAAFVAVDLRRAGAAHRRGAANAAAALAGALLACGVAITGGGESPLAHDCPDTPLMQHLKTLPEDAIVAGNPVRLGCVEIVAERAVVITKKLYQPWDLDYFAVSRERMERVVRAYYGGSMERILELRRRYGADVLVVDRYLSRRGWRHFAPYTGLVLRLRRAVKHPAVKRLPASCLTWEDAAALVYDLDCVERAEAAVSRSSSRRL